MSTIHSEMLGTELHEAFQFVQEGDPGAVGAGLYWLKVSTGALKKRSSDNLSWLPVGTGATAFSQLSDVPPYAGNAGKFLQINPGETGLDAVDGVLPEWLSNSPDAVPAVPNAMDDEFLDADKLPGGGTPLWAWRNQGTATVLDAFSHVQLKALATAPADDVKIIEQNAPSSPWEFTAKICNEYKTIPANSVMGIVAVDTSSGKLFVVGFQQASGGQVSTATYTTVTSGASVVNYALVGRTPFYIRLKDDGTNFIVSYSICGAHFQTILTQSRVTHLSGPANKIGICCASESTEFSVLDCDWFRRTV